MNCEYAVGQTYNSEYTPSMQEKIEILKARWNAERLIWLSHRATDKTLVAHDAYVNLDELMDFALDLGLVLGHPLQTDSPAGMVETADGLA